MKKAIVPIALVLCAVIMSCLSPYVRYRDMQTTLNVDFSKVDKVIISSGNTSKTSEIEGAGNLKDFFAIFDGVKLKKVLTIRFIKELCSRLRCTAPTVKLLNLISAEIL